MASQPPLSSGSPDLRDKLQATLGDAVTLERELGGGGMSRVFLAEETALGRKIVVKILPSDTAAGVSVERFKREVHVIARLQHPHIVPILSAGEIKSSGSETALPFYTMPYVKGESLRARLSRGGELSVGDAIHILRDVAAALGYAHGEGVVHRDIKPDNVIVSGGVAVVTDFGVAKAVDLAVSEGDRPHTAITSLGVALGTPAYMAPEQASADPKIDHRADIYSFGVLAYELLAGSSPFAGRPPSQILAAHVTEKPEPIQKRRPNIPAPLAGLIMRCLEKQAGDRPQSADEILSALDAIATTPSGGMQPTDSVAAGGTRGTVRRMAIGGAAAVLIAVLYFALKGRDAPALSIGTTTPIANTTALEGEPGISPDGKLVAYTAETPNGTGIFLRQIDGGRSTLLTQGIPGEPYWPRWSPDQSRISFASDDGSIYVIPALTGGSPRRLVQGGATHAWSPDGTEIVFGRVDGIWVQAVTGGAARPIVKGEFLHSPVFSPDGKLIAYAAGRRPQFDNLSANRIFIVSAAGGDPVAVSDSTGVNVSPAWMPDGRSILFVSNKDGTRDVYQQRVTSSGTRSGAPVRVTTSLASFAMTLSADGTRLAYDAVRNQSNIWWVPIGPQRARIADATAVTNELQTIESMSLSPDGRWLAYDSNRGGSFDIYKLPLDRPGEPVQVTTHPANDFAPTWSRDGREIAFHTARNGTRDIYTVATDGTGEAQVSSGPREDFSPTWGRPGTLIWFDLTSRVGTMWGATRDASGRWAERRLSPEGVSTSSGRWSPDGSLIAHARNGELGVSLPDGTGWRLLASRETLKGVLRSVDWSPDGSMVYVSVLHSRPTDAPNVPLVEQREILAGDPVLGAVPQGNSIIAIPANGGRPRILLAEEPNARFGRWEFAVDAKKLYFTRATWESDVWVVELRQDR